MAVLLAGLAGCEAQTPPSGAGGPVDRQAEVLARPQPLKAEVPDAVEDRWLTWKDTRDPIAWLAGFDDAADAGSPQRYEALIQVIGELDARYLEDPRMLANRTVQLRNMLTEIGVREDMLGLLRGFATLTRGAEGREDQFGEKVAFYVRLRGSGATHLVALQRIEAGSPADIPEGLPPLSPGAPEP
jgi:hypothetical protein